MGTKVALSKAIEAHGVQVKELDLAEPNGKSIMRCGIPMSYEQKPNGNVVTHVDAEAIGNYISELAAIPVSSVEQLAPADFIRCTEVVSGFFNMADLVTT